MSAYSVNTFKDSVVVNVVVVVGGGGAVAIRTDRNLQLHLGNTTVIFLLLI